MVLGMVVQGEDALNLFPFSVFGCNACSAFVDWIRDELVNDA